MIRTPARKEIKILTNNNVKVVDGVLYIQSEPPIVLPGESDKSGYKVSQCSWSCAEDGIPEQVDITVPTTPTVCDCPYVYGLTISFIPDNTLADIDNTFTTKKLYEHSNADGSNATAAEVVTGLLAQLQADKFITDRFTVSSPAATVLRFVGKKNGHFANFYASSGSGVVITIPGVEDGLTVNKLYRMFPLEHGKFAEMPPATFCGNYCILTAHLKECCSNASDAADVSMDRANQGANFDILWAIPSKTFDLADADYNATLHENLKAYFDCLPSTTP